MIDELMTMMSDGDGQQTESNGPKKTLMTMMSDDDDQRTPCEYERMTMTTTNAMSDDTTTMTMTMSIVLWEEG